MSVRYDNKNRIISVRWQVVESNGKGKNAKGMRCKFRKVM